jgi:hypothetical protein
MYRVEVAWLLDAGEPLRDVDEGIERITDLTQDERASLRQFASAWRGPSERQEVAADISAPSSGGESRSRAAASIERLTRLARRG